MKKNLKNKKEDLRNIKKNFIKESEIEPNLKYEISKIQENNKKNNRTS